MVFLHINWLEMVRLGLKQDGAPFRLLSTASLCTGSESVVVQYVANYGILHGHMKSFIGRNLVTCSEHFNISVYNLVNAGFNGKSVKSLFVR